MIPRACKVGRRPTKWTLVAQLQLFPSTAAPSPQHRNPCEQRKEATAGMGRKSTIDMEPVQRVVPAAQSPLPSMLGARSVFDLGAALVKLSATPAADTSPPPAAGRIIVREGGITRHIAVRAQDTDEWAEKERQRRARQRPPRPSRQKFKMKGSRAWADQSSA
jgi:hypothetical protein